jgi:outer membrane protein
MKRTLVVIAALIAPSFTGAQESARPITLDEALELARRNAPSMISARGQLRTTAAQARVAKWAYNPLNNLNLTYGSSTGGGGSYDADGFFRERPSTSWGFSQGFGNASLTLWDGGTKLANIRRTGAQVEQAEINEITQGYAVGNQVKTQYYLVLRQREALATAEQQLENARFQMQLARARVENGIAIHSDTLQSLIAILAAENAILNARNGLSNANAQLTRLTASQFPVTAIVSDTTDPAPLQINDAELFALAEQGPAVRNSEASYNVARINERGAHAVRWPQINAGASFGRSNSEQKSSGSFFSGYDFGAGPMNYSWGFSLSASYRLFDGFQRESSILSAKVNLDNAEANLREARLAARQNLTQQLGTLRTNEAQIGIARLQLAAAEEALRVVQLRYEMGVATLLELTTAQQSVTTARNSLTNSRFDVRNARASIEALIGRDLQ